MAAPTYNSAKHHIGLKDRGGATNYGFLLHGGYAKDAQREAIGSPDFGGATDLIGQTPSVSRWTQDDFIGGQYAYNWGRDDAMFASCQGFIPSQQARSLISCPPLFLKKAYDPDAATHWTTDTPIAMFMVNASIYVVWSYGILRYRIDTDGTTFEDDSTILIDNDGTMTIAAAEWDSNNQCIWILTTDTTASATGQVIRVNGDLTVEANASWPWPTGTEDLVGRGMSIQGKNLVCAIGNRLYSWAMPVKLSVVADLGTWTEIGRLPGRWVGYTPYNGMIYILCTDGSFKTQIVAFDGTSILPIVTIPHSFYGKSIIEYAGRVFIGGTGTDINGGEHYAELYELTGASVRLVRTFSPETRNYFLGGAAGEWPTSIDTMAVHEGLLWFPQKGKQMLTYDVSSDGFFGSSDIQNANLNIAKITSGRGRLWMFGVDSTDDTKHGIYRIAQPADSASLTAWNPTLITSDFNYEPALKKRWGKLRTMTRYGSVSSADYSINGGESWTALTVTPTSSYGKIYYTDIDLAAIAPSEHIRFRFKLGISGEGGDIVTYHREFVSYTVSFAMLDTGKHAWNFTINGSLEVETYDAEYTEGATVQAQDLTDVATLLWGYSDNKTALTFTDMDGSSYDVQMVALRESQPVIAPEISGESRAEAFYNVTLLEV